MIEAVKLLMLLLALNPHGPPIVYCACNRPLHCYCAWFSDPQTRPSELNGELGWCNPPSYVSCHMPPWTLKKKNLIIRTKPKPSIEDSYGIPCPRSSETGQTSKRRQRSRVVLALSVCEFRCWTTFKRQCM